MALFCGLFAMEQQQQKTIAEFEARNRQLELSLKQQRQQLKQMSTLAESESRQIRSELEKRDQDLTKLSQMLGEQERKARPHVAPMAARRGQRLPLGALEHDFGQLRQQLHNENSELERLARVSRELHWRYTPSGSPCAGEMTSGYGSRIHPVYGIGRFHKGCDFTAPYSTKIFATADGVVTRSDWLAGYGKVVEIQHRHGLSTLYAHCSEWNVRQGQRVSKGQWIARVGQTGLASGPHCHYEVHLQGEQIDPKPYLAPMERPQ